MAQYLDLCIMPIPKKYLAEYKKTTRIVGKILLKYGALASRDYLADDKNATSGPLAKTIKLKKGEVLIVAEAIFKSAAHRDKVFKAMAKDPTMEKLGLGPDTMDHKRAIVGGFSLLVGVEK
jgi:uncharacterized protein YbaA (DUF1428 family)